MSIRFTEWAAARLAETGTRFAFGVPGGGPSLDWLDAFRRHGIQSVLSAREDAGVIMAGVAGAITGAPGVAFTTKGPGLASAANGVASASLDRLPALLLSEGFDKDELRFLTHQVFDQSELITPFLINPAASCMEPTPQALDAWLTQQPFPPRGPGVMFTAAPELGLQVDEDVRRPTASNRSIDGDVEATRKALAGAKRPVVVIGLDASRIADAAPIRTFVESLGGPVLCTYMGKGVIPDEHPQWAGIFTGGAIERPLMESADRIVLLGVDPVEFIRKPWTYSPPVIDLCERVFMPHYLVPEQRLTGDLNAIVHALAPCGGDVAWQPAELAAYKQGFLDGMNVPSDGSLDSTAIVQDAARCFAPTRRVSVDAGAHMFSACAFWPCNEPLDLLISNGLASMGFAVPAAIAAALADPARGAVALTGDGGLLMCLGELRTAAESGARVCIIVFNDACLSLIDIKRQDRQLPPLGMSWAPPDFAAVARGFGLKAWNASTEEEFAHALGEAQSVDGPCLIDARVDPATYPEQIKRLRG
jgi:acetolactate synthase I/II/III large subunit